MKQTIEIEVPEGKEAIWKDGKVFFIDKKSELSKTWEEFCRNYPVKRGECMINNCSAINYLTECAFRSPYSDANNLPSFEAAKAHLALMQLHQLRDCYRQGWVPNWESYEKKFAVTRVSGKELHVGGALFINNFLVFQSREIAEQFLDNFRDLIEQAGDLI